MTVDNNIEISNSIDSIDSSSSSRIANKHSRRPTCHRPNASRGTLSSILLLSLLSSTFVNIVDALVPISNFEKKIALNSSDFFELVANDVFVDKTSPFIEACVKEPGLVDEFLRPAGWGKTTNLNMLKRFLEIETDEHGNPLPDERKINRKYFVGGKISNGDNVVDLKPLRIAESEEAMAVQGLFPVIYLSLADVTGDTYGEVETSFVRLMADLYGRFEYLRRNLTDDDGELKLFTSYLEGRVNRTELTNGLNFLTGLLRCRYFDRKVYVLIDDYDEPLNRLFLRQLKKYRSTKIPYKTVTEKHIFYYAGASDDVSDVLDLLTDLLGDKAKLNHHLKHMFIAGQFKYRLTEFIGGVHDQPSYNLLNGHYRQSFGFTADDINRLLNVVSFKPNRTKIDEWYRLNVTGYKSYNPLSIRHFLANEAIFDDYWARSYIPIINNRNNNNNNNNNNNEVISNTIAEEVLLSDYMQPKVQELHDGRTVCLGLRRRMELYNVIRDASALVPSGYLNVQPFDYTNRVNVTAANREIKNVLERAIKRWTFRKLNATVDDFEGMVDDLLEMEMDKFRDRLAGLMAVFPKYVFPWDAEVCYDALMKTLLYTFSTEYRRERYVDRKIDDKKPILAVIGVPDVTLTAVLIAYKIVEDADDFKTEVERRQRLNDVQSLLPDFDSRRYSHIDRLVRVNLLFCRKQFDLKYDVQRRLQLKKTTNAWVQV